MTPDERELLTGFLDELRRVPPGQRDPEAVRMIEDALLDRPDTLYPLIQHSLLADQALNDAQRRIEELEAQVKAGQEPSQSFLRRSPSPWGNDRDRGLVPPSAPRDAAPREGYARENPGYYGGGAPQQGGGTGSFLRNAAATAAGLAGGAFLFQGLSNMFGQQQHHNTDSFLGGGDGLPHIAEHGTVDEYKVAETTPEHLADTGSDPDDDADYYSNDTDDDGGDTSDA